MVSRVTCFTTYRTIHDDRFTEVGSHDVLFAVAEGTTEAVSLHSTTTPTALGPWHGSGTPAGGVISQLRENYAGLGGCQAHFPPAVARRLLLKSSYRRDRVTRDRPVTLRVRVAESVTRIFFAPRTGQRAAPA